jgi:hypothetical protein
MALKQFYATEADVPTELKEHYTEKDGRYILAVDGIENLPGLTSKNAELIAKQKSDKAEQERLTTDLAESKIEIGKLSGDIAKASANALPTGYVAVAKKDAEALEELRKQNLAPAEVLTKLNELDGLKAKVGEFELSTAITAFAEAEGIKNVDALSRLIKQDGVIPSVKEVDKDGKKEKRGFLTIPGDKPEEKAYKEYLDSNWKAFASALDVKEPKKPGAGPDPKPSGSPSDDDETAKAAVAGQGRAIHSAF